MRLFVKHLQRSGGTKDQSDKSKGISSILNIFFTAYFVYQLGLTLLVSCTHI